MADGGAPTASAYGNRTIALRLQLLGVADDQAAEQMALLIRELDRPTNVLLYQPGTASPVFFRTYRTGPDSIDFDPYNKELAVDVLAEPAAYGLEEAVGPWTVSNNPVAASNAMAVDVTGVKGDVQTPLHLVVSSGAVAAGRRRAGLSVRRRGTPSAVPLVLQAESMTQGTDTTVQANSATMSGSGSNYSRITFTAQAGLTQRLSVSKFPSTASVDARGAYRVFARIRQNTSTDAIDVRLRWGAADALISNSNVRLPQNTALHYVDLGLIQIPSGYDPATRGPSGVELPVDGVSLAVDARRVLGSGSLDVDVLLLWPADDRASFVLWPEAITGVTDFWVEGGVAPQAYARNAAGQVASTQAIEIVGLGLMVSPGVTNRVFYGRDLGTSATGGDDVAGTSTLSGSYWPLYLRPATS